jgi:hypothetical protein
MVFVVICTLILTHFSELHELISFIIRVIRFDPREFVFTI